MSADDDLLQEIRDRFKHDSAEWDDIRTEGDIDMRYVAGDPWEPADRRKRTDANRPCLSEDELNQYFNQVINNVRANPRSVKFTPQGNGANDETAEFYADKMREIEYRSHAQLAYITAFENCVQRSFGWVRLTTKYASNRVDSASPDAFLKDLWIKAIVNPNMVIPGPALLPDSSDMNHLFYLEQMERDEFRREYPNAAITDFNQEFIQKVNASDWFKGGKVQVGEYWKTAVIGKRKLFLLEPGPATAENPNPQPLTAFEDELSTPPKDKQIREARDIDQIEVRQYVTNGVEILKRAIWPGKYIPFASCLGKVIYVQGADGAKRHILSLTRLARHPQMLYAYYCTTEAEIVGGIPKFPYFYYEGQLTPESLTDIAKSLHEPVAAISVKPTSPMTGPELLPHPQRQPWDPPLQGIQLGKEAQRRAIQAAMGVTPLPTNAQKRNDKSGVALQQIEKSEQLGSFHFGAHLDDMLRHVGVMVEDLMDKVLDTARTTPVRKADDSTKQLRINDHQVPDGQKPLFTKGDHAVTVSSGPAADSQREAVAEFVESLSRIPQVMAVAGDLIVRLQSKTMNLGPLMEELADRLTPPQFQKPKDGQAPDPKQLMAQLQMAGQENAQLKDAVTKLSMEIKTKQIEFQEQRQTELMKADKQGALQIELKKMDIAGKLEAARITAAKQSADLEAEANEEAIALHQEQAHEAIEAGKDRQHDVNLALLDHATATAQQDQAHEHALEQGDQGIAGGLVQGQQDAALAPPPATGAGA